MKSTRIFFILICAIGIFLYDTIFCGPSTAIAGNGETELGAEQPKDKQEHVDDLSWLAGRWKCITREYLEKPDSPLGDATEDNLDYFNVYLPYADDHLTLKLTSNPDDRPIAAEFIVRFPEFGRRQFREEITRMQPSGVVRIGSDKIWVGYSTDKFEFKYARVEGGPPLHMVLESKHTRMVLERFGLYGGSMDDDLTNSLVQAPIMKYSAEKRRLLKIQYDELVRKEAGSNTNSTITSPQN